MAFHTSPDRFPGGFIGVDIFFVISGYLISGIILSELSRGNGFDFLSFYGRRVRRIFPALSVVLLSCYIYGWIRQFPTDFSRWGKHIAAGAGFASNFILWSEAGYFDLDSFSKPLLHLWSLGIEEQFYLAWPLILWVAWKHKIDAIYPILITLLSSFFLNVALIHTNKVSVFYAPWTRVWELLIGAALAYHHKKSAAASVAYMQHAVSSPSKAFHAFAPKWCSNSSMALANVCGVAGLLLIALGLALITDKSAFPGWLALLPVVGSVLILAAGPDVYINRAILSRKIFVGIGLISYPLYLWHWPMLSLAWVHQSEFSRIEFAMLRCGIVAASFLLAYLSFAFIERPIRYGKHPGRQTSLIALAVTLIGAAGIVTYLSDGFPSRYSKQIMAIAAYTYDYDTGYRQGTSFLKEDQDYSAFSNCTINVDNSHSILLWGDSHAAHLYPGLVALKGKSHKIMQYTASGCPPIIGISVSDRPYCQDINNYVIDMAAVDVPDEVILSAAWESSHVEMDNAPRFANTIQRLRALGIKNIQIIGPSPLFKNDLQNMLARAALEDYSRIPTRRKISQSQYEMDSKVESFAMKQNVKYLSALKIMCDSDGCLVRGNDPADLYFWDGSHLTESGSKFLVSHFPE